MLNRKIGILHISVPDFVIGTRTLYSTFLLIVSSERGHATARGVTSTGSSAPVRSEGEKDLCYRRGLVGRLERRGRDAGEARDLLARIEGMQDEYLQYEARISNRVMLILKGF